MTSGKPFRGWYKKNGTSYTKVSDNIKYIFEADGNATYVADTDYSITYNLNGGTVATANPGIYNLKDAFTLNNPTKYLYDFMGWTGTGLSAQTKTVSVPKGSYGNRSYTANWETGFLHADDPYSKVTNIKAFINTCDNRYEITFRCGGHGDFFVQDGNDASYTLIYAAGSAAAKSNAQENAVCAAHVGDIINYILYQVYKDELHGLSDQLLTSTNTTGTAYGIINEPPYMYAGWQGARRAEAGSTNFAILINGLDDNRYLYSDTAGCINCSY